MLKVTFCIFYYFERKITFEENNEGRMKHKFTFCLVLVTKSRNIRFENLRLRRYFIDKLQYIASNVDMLCH